MRKRWVLAGAAVLVAVTATVGAVVMSSAKQATPAAQEPPANTATVEKGQLSAMVSLDGTLTYRARSDGSPYAVSNRARGTYTKLPAEGDKVDCGDVLYRVDDNPTSADAATARAAVDAAIRQLADAQSTVAAARAMAAEDRAAAQQGVANASQALANAQKSAQASIASAQQDVQVSKAGQDAAATTLKNAESALASTQASVQAALSADGVGVANAQKNLASAQDQAAKSAQSNDVAVKSTQTALDNAQKNLTAVQTQVAAQLKVGEAAIPTANNNINSVDIARDAACGRGTDSIECKQAQAQVNAATTALDQANAQLKLQQAQGQASIQSAQTAIDQAQAALKAAQAQAAQQAAASQASIQTAQAAANKAAAAQQNDQAKNAQSVQQAQAQVDQAKSSVTSAGASAAQVQSNFAASAVGARAQIDQAQSALKTAQANLASTQAKGEQAVVAARSQVDAAVSAQQTAKANYDKLVAPPTLVLLLCGTVPAYRDLHTGDVGQDVRQLNRNLHQLGYDADAGVDINPDDNAFTSKTEKALEVLQHDKGVDVTGELAFGDAVFLPESVRIAKVAAELGGSAQPGASVLYATSDTPEVQVDLEASQQGEVKEGDRAQITLPGNESVTGKVDRLGRVARVPAGQDNKAGAATIPAYISLDDPAKARGLDKAPVQVEIATQVVESALSVPVTALVGKAGGGFAVEVARAGGRRELVAVKLGLFDSAGARVQVEGELREGDHVVVPSS